MFGVVPARYPESVANTIRQEQHCFVFGLLISLHHKASTMKIQIYVELISPCMSARVVLHDMRHVKASKFTTYKSDFFIQDFKL